MRSLSFSQLVGSPIVAIVQAEAMAARASADFIESVGFVKQDGSDENAYGKLRTVTFSYTKQDVNGVPVIEEVELPLLSLVPIPLLQVKDAQLSFNAKIVESIAERAQTHTLIGERLKVPASQRAVSLMGVYKSVGASTDTVNSSTDVKITISLVQSDVPVGLQQLFQIMENAASSRQVEK